MANNSSGKKLKRSKTNKMILGVCGGIGEYFGVDPTIVRLATVILGLVTGGFLVVVAYVVAAIVMPE